MELTAQQQATVKELQGELQSLNLQADIEWAKYVHTNDRDCYNQVLALESEIELKGLIAYLPKAGERKIEKIKNLIGKIKQAPAVEIGQSENRIKALNSVNDWRDSYNLPPLERLPQGTPGDSSECTLAQAFTLSLQELGVQFVEVEVQSNNEIRLDGMRHGEEWTDRPHLDKSAQYLIDGFDANDWLDLLTNDALRGYAFDTWQDENWDRLDEISDEFQRRGLTHDLTIYGDVVLGTGEPIDWARFDDNGEYNDLEQD